MFNWNGEKFPFCVLDADTAKKFDDAEAKMWDRMREYEAEHAENGRLTTEGLAEESDIISEFFDDVFGKGAAKKMFMKEHDLSERVKAVKKLYTLKSNQLSEHEKNVNIISDLAFRKGDK